MLLAYIKNCNYIKLFKNKFFLLFILYFVYQSLIYIKFHMQHDWSYIQLAMAGCMFSLICSLSIAENLKYFSKNIFIITIIIFSVFTFYISSKILFYAIENGDLYLYWTNSVNPAGQTLGQANPRVTGLSRTLLIFFVFLFFSTQKFNKLMKFLTYIVLFFSLFILYGMQTRGALIGLIIFLIIYLFFVNEVFYKKMLKIFFLIILPIIVYENLMYKNLMHKNLLYKNLENKNLENKNLEEKLNNVFEEKEQIEEKQEKVTKEIEQLEKDLAGANVQERATIEKQLEALEEEFEEIEEEVTEIEQEIQMVAKEKVTVENKNLEHKKFKSTGRYVLNSGINNHTSGRMALWKLSLNLIKQYKIILGVGPQGDRQIFDFHRQKSKQIIKTIQWSTNVSNGYIYSYLSAGILGFSIALIVTIILVKEVFVAVFINKIFTKNSDLNYLSIFCVIFLCFRNLFENGIFYFGIDFIFILISYLNLYKFNNNLKNKITK